MTESFHPFTWLIWTLAAAVLAIITLNPLYLMLLGLAALVNYLAIGRRSALAQSWGAFLKLGMLVWVITIPFNMLMVHTGALVLFNLPANWPLIGGPITLEAVAYGFAKGLSLIVILLIFAAFNSAVDQARLLRRLPSFLYMISMITSIALAFVPQMVTVMREIREAQRLRGHQFRRVRDLLPLFIPLLTTGMERAIQLAESMESRGFGGHIAPSSSRREIVQKLLMLIGLLGLLFGLFASSYWTTQRWIGFLAAGIGTAVLVAVFWSQSRRVRRTRYRRDLWQQRDTLVSAASLLGLIGLVGMRLADRAALFYYPYPPYSIWPAFDPRLGLLLILFAAPAIFLPAPVRPVVAQEELS